MAKEFAKTFYNSKEWKKCRAAYIKSVDGLCERCNELGLILHHKKELNPRNINNPNITLNWDNLEYLCQECHNKHHNSKYSPTRSGLRFDEQGRLVKE